MSHLTPDELTLAALGTEDETRPARREHLREGPICAAEVAALRGPVDHLRGAGVDPEPPASVWASIRRELGDEPPGLSATPTPLTPLAPPPRRRRRWLVPGLAAAAAAVLAAVVVTVSVLRTDSADLTTGAPVVMRSEPGCGPP